MLLLLAACGTMSVANVYYAQPLLDSIADEFAISHAAVGGVITSIHIGCALALLLVVPLGDLVNRKRLICAQLVLLTGALALVIWSPSWILMLIGMAAIGLLGTAMTQGLIAYSANMAPESERGRVVGTVQSGVVIGLLSARSLAGFSADVSGWRAVYVISAALSLLMLVVLSRALPTPRAPARKLRYSELLGSMLQLIQSERTLQVRGVLCLLMFAAFSVFWSTLVLPLSAAPHSMSHTTIGAFGLIGLVGALAAAGAGRWADRGLGQPATCIALLCMLLSWAPIALLHHSLLALMLGIILLDLGGQAIHVLNQSMILNNKPETHSRLVACYMLFYAAGSGLGAIASTFVFSRAGWLGVCALGFSISSVAFVFWLVTRKWMCRGQNP
jgi:predicted MFS family arabinose efflux permease